MTKNSFAAEVTFKTLQQKTVLYVACHAKHYFVFCSQTCFMLQIC